MSPQQVHAALWPERSLREGASAMTQCCPHRAVIRDGRPMGAKGWPEPDVKPCSGVEMPVCS